MARAFLAAAESEVSNEVFNVGSNKTFSVNYLADLLGGRKVYIPKRPGEPDCTFAEIEKIKRVLNWKAEVSFEEGVKIMLDNIDYWRDAPIWEPESIDTATKEWFHLLGKKNE